MIYDAQIQVYIQNYKSIAFYYSFNNESTFEDLLEFTSYLVPAANICHCFKFKSYYNYNLFELKNDYKILMYQDYLNNLTLSPDNNNRRCQCEDQYLKYSKKICKNNYINELNNLINKNKIKSNQIEALEKEKRDNQNKYNQLKIENDYKGLKISNLERENNKQKKNINSLKDDNKEISNKNKILEMAVNGDHDKIVFLNENGIIGNNLKLKDNIIKINPKNNQLIGNEIHNKTKFIDFYDVIIHINSIKDINKGWKIEVNPKARENYENFKKLNIIKIGVIGNSNKGKSFLLSKISKIPLPSGTSIRTEGLSIKYPDLDEFKDRKIALLDSAGLETPVLKINDIINDKKNEFFKEKSREKLITELFLQNYIINNSDVLIAVVGILSYSEQKLLMKIKKEIERSKLSIPLFIIHNLVTYTSVEQVEEYISEFLLKSATFNLIEGHKISTKTKSKTGKYFYESIENQKIFHLIFANEGSKAGDYYNHFTLDFLENNYQNVTHLKPFDVIETIKDRYIQVSKDIIERTAEDKIDRDSFDDSVPELLKLKDAKPIVLKKCLTDELGFSNLKANGFEPTYNIYHKDNSIILRIEASGNCSIDALDIEFSGEYNIIKVRGEKKKDKEPIKDEDNIFNTREYGKFLIEIPLKAEEYYLKNEQPNLITKRGVFMIEYQLCKKFKAEGFKMTVEDEI